MFRERSREAVPNLKEFPSPESIAELGIPTNPNDLRGNKYYSLKDTYDEVSVYWVLPSHTGPDDDGLSLFIAGQGCSIGIGNTTVTARADLMSIIEMIDNRGFLHIDGAIGLSLHEISKFVSDPGVDWIRVRDPETGDILEISDIEIDLEDTDTDEEFPTKTFKFYATKAIIFKKENIEVPS
jgi:hypothetical protein